MLSLCLGYMMKSVVRLLNSLSLAINKQHEFLFTYRLSLSMVHTFIRMHMHVCPFLFVNVLNPRRKTSPLELGDMFI